MEAVDLHHGVVGVDLELTLEDVVCRLVARKFLVINLIVILMAGVSAFPPLE